MAESSFFNSDQFMPHGMCYLWQTDVLWTTVVADLFTAVAYFSFTIAFIVFVKKRKNLQYSWFFVLAGSIVFLACGVSHLLAVVVIWKPIYGVLAIVKAMTAISSVVAGVAIWYVLPFFLELPSPSDLQKEKDKSDQYGREVKQLNDSLEHQVKERTSELERLKNYMQNIIDSMPSVLIGIDGSLNITQWNKTAEELVGIPAKEVLGRPLDLVSSTWDIEGNEVKRAIDTNTQSTKNNKSRIDDGIRIYEDITIYPLHTSSMEGAVIRIDDVTAEVRLQETLIQSEKMLSVGGLAAGMAHEINNPLAGMVQTANVMKQRLLDPNLPANLKVADSLGISLKNIYDYIDKRDIPRMLNAITDSGARVADIVENMLSFARKSEEIISSHNVAELLDKTLELSATDYDLKKHYDFKAITIIKEYEANLDEIPCDGAKIQQVLLNIFRNGAEAMQEAMTPDPHFIIRVFEQPIVHSLKTFLTIEIEDNGPGMGEETKRRIFEPFFTTKAVGVGTGLGLSVSYFIITENHGGQLFVESTLGKGTKFVIQLPTSRKGGENENNLNLG